KDVDRNGNERTYSWKIEQKQVDIDTNEDPVYVDIYCPLSVTYPCGRSITFEYSTDSGEEYLCVKANSPSGFEVEYAYTNGLLTGIEKSNSQYLQYAYETASDEYKTAGWLTKITYANGAEV